MRILYVSHTHPPEGEILENVGGMQRVSQQLIQELKRKESVDVITETINVSEKGKIALQTIGFLLKQIVSLPHKVRESDADIILFSSMVTASLAFFIRHKISVPMVTINHGRDVTLPVRAYQWFVPKIFDNLDGVISVSRATREECIARGMDPEKGVALPNGFDFNKLNNFPDKKKARNRLQENFRIPLESHRMLLTVGRMVKRKGHEWFIREVMPKLNKQMVYVTVGDGPEFDNITKAAEGSSFSDRIFILGRQPDEVLKQAYAAADLFVMPNIPVPGDMEGFGIVLLEANMAENPAVAANLEGIKDVIGQGKNGYRVPPLNADLFAEKIEEILSGPLEQFSKNSRNYVQEQFSWQHVSQQYVDYLETIAQHF
ncbi:glycosyltransferase family 4 protein [Fodinibius saliphilus]|uniref:glycosyltransferase family 4 protein n=1 Tax=Fodinibius saliphilus TaxID=1920650 RepID=UPI001FE60929|nr:glycosyltransferase family 4 protein [Fodinibius saliphilus]